MEVEQLILKSLVSDIEFARKTIPYLKPDYFNEKPQQIIYLIADEYFRKYNKCASIDVLQIELQKAPGLSETIYNSTNSLINELTDLNVEGDLQWRVDEAERFCQDKAIYNGIMQSIAIIQGEDKKLNRDAIPDILKEALGVCFDTKMGHDYIDDAEHQFLYYTSPQTKIPFDIDKLNEVTNGGVTRKTLNLDIAATHGGKTLSMCHKAAAHYAMGYNVLYLTMEESEEKIRTRIDANLLGVDMDDIAAISREEYFKRIGRIRAKTVGKLKIREFPTAGASAANFRYYIQELAIKKNFIPDVIYIDYLNLCASSRIRHADNSYAYHKAVAEELRGLAKETNTALFTATQLNREGFKDSDPDMGLISDSFGVAFTADFACILIGSEELTRAGQIMIKQEKNRYKDLNYCKRFVIGLDRQRMRLYDAENSAQPVRDIDYGIENKITSRNDKAKKFADFK